MPEGYHPPGQQGGRPLDQPEDHPPEQQGFRRRRTLQPPRARSLIQSISRRWTTLDESRANYGNGPVMESYCRYAGLEWKTLKDYLEKKWEGWTLDEGKVRKVRDEWRFEVPWPLSQDDRDQLAALRDINHSQRRPSFSDEEN